MYMKLCSYLIIPLFIEKYFTWARNSYRGEKEHLDITHQEKVFLKMRVTP